MAHVRGRQEPNSRFALTTNRTTDQQNHKPTEPQNNRTTKQQNNRTTKQQNHRTTEYRIQKHRNKEIPCIFPPLFFMHGVVRLRMEIDYLFFSVAISQKTLSSRRSTSTLITSLTSSPVERIFFFCFPRLIFMILSIPPKSRSS
jgi:hypothetical protein